MTGDSEAVPGGACERGITRDQRRNVYSGHPPPISLRETPKCLSAVNWIQGLFPNIYRHIERLWCKFGTPQTLFPPGTSRMDAVDAWVRHWCDGCAVDLSAHV